MLADGEGVLTSSIATTEMRSPYFDKPLEILPFKSETCDKGSVGEDTFERYLRYRYMWGKLLKTTAGVRCVK